LVTIEVKRIESGKLVDSRTFPALGGAHELDASQAGRLEALLVPLRKAAEDRSLVFPKVVALAATAADGIKELASRAPADRLVANTHTIIPIVTEERYYINTVQPLIGSSNSTYKLSADGTLLEATANVQDDTVKTLLGLFPINAKIADRWNVEAEKSTDGAVQSKAVAPAVVELVVTVVEQRQLYTLRKMRPTDLAPLTIAQSQEAKPTVELVSVEMVTDEPKPKPDTTSYSINLQGNESPPKADDKK
jgi:hypothetical protein